MIADPEENFTCLGSIYRHPPKFVNVGALLVRIAEPTDIFGVADRTDIFGVDDGNDPKRDKQALCGVAEPNPLHSRMVAQAASGV